MSEADSGGGGGTSLPISLQNLNKKLIRKNITVPPILHILNLPLNVKNCLLLHVYKVSCIDSGDNGEKNSVCSVCL